MNHSEVEELLGAYALDAVDSDEAAGIERHLHDCPRCRAELAAHREMAALLGNSGGDAPAEIWDRIAAQIAAGPELPQAVPAPPIGRGEIVPIASAGGAGPERGEPAAIHEPAMHLEPGAHHEPGARQYPGRRPGGWAPMALGGVAAALVAVVVLLGVQISHLEGQVHGLQNALPILTTSAQALAAENSPHQSVTLTSASAGLHAEAVIAPDNEAFVVSSDLAALSPDQTYQLWALVNGHPVSLGVAGSAPAGASHVWTFNVQPDMTRIMVTVEPEGGVPAPTTQVLVQSPVHIV